MPTLLPGRLPKVKPEQAAPSARTIDWLSVWALSIGLAAVLVAAIVYFIGNDSLDASFVLFGAAALVTLLSQGAGAFDQ